MQLVRRCAWVSAVLVAVSAWPALALAAPTAAGVTVSAGPPLTAPPPGVSPHADALFFYPKTVTVQVGEPVTWHFFGFHTVTFAGTHRPYPFFVPAGRQPATNDAGGQPFWWGGKAPNLVVSPLSILPQGGSTVSSRAQTASSGLMRIFQSTQKNPPAPYTLVFTKPGVYHYQCAVHSGMHGSVIVVPSGHGSPSAASESAAAHARLQATVADLKRMQVAKPKKSLTVWVGQGHTATGAELTAFFPEKLVVNVGDTVTFANHDQTDIHTVTFGPEKLRSEIEKNFVAPAGKTFKLNPLGGFSSEPPPGTAVQYDGSNHGNGYINSGLLAPPGSPPAAGSSVFRVTFTKAGTYHYECVIHTNMDGTIVVH
jgi:plastocyanin